MRFILKTRFFFVLLAALLAAQAFIGPNAIAHRQRRLYVEGELASTKFYAIPDDIEVIDWLQNFTVQITETMSDGTLDRDSAELMLGDTWHWIGHVAEDQGNFERAWSAFHEAYDHYRRSEETHSSYIGDLNTLEHAKRHILKLAEKMGRTAPEGMTFNGNDALEDRSELIYRRMEYQSHIGAVLMHTQGAFSCLRLVENTDE